MEHFYKTLFSNSSQKTYTANTLADFTIQLAQSIDLQGSSDNWEVGLCEISCPPNTTGVTNALIYCDLITQQFVGSDYVRCLRSFSQPTKNGNLAFQNVYYVPVEKRIFHDISITIIDLNGKKIPFVSGEVPVKLVLHFRRV
jgi:hypothetical protein